MYINLLLIINQTKVVFGPKDGVESNFVVENGFKPFLDDVSCGKVNLIT